jgi:polyisoprenoid-binding protein YceI
MGKEPHMNRKATLSLAIGIPIILIVGVVLYGLSLGGYLPGQTQPTAIPVTPFANVAATAPASTAIAASTATTAPAAATTAPTVAAAASNSGSGGSGYGGGDYGYGNSSAASNASATTAPASGASSSAATALAGSAVAKAPGGATTYTIAGDKSQAKVTVNEKLAQLPSPSDAVLTTNAIQGQLFLGPDTKPVEGAKIMVDLRTLKSDRTQRDNYIRNNTLQSDQFPLAEYVITGVDGWTGPLKEGQQSTFKLLGNMTIHGVTKPVTFDTTAMMQGGAVTGTAATTFKFQDFGMTPPSVSIAKATDTIKLDMNIVASKAA